MTQQNPFGRAYAAIESALKAWSPLTTLVFPGNIQNLQATGYKPRNTVQSADRPELMLTEQRMGFQPFSFNATGVSFRCSYPLKISSGSLGIEKLNIVSWEVGRALNAIGPQLGMPEIVQEWEIPSDGQARASDPTAKRPDWTVLLVIVVQFAMTRQQYMNTTFT